MLLKTPEDITANIALMKGNTETRAQSYPNKFTVMTQTIRQACIET
jgi:hypothetical protein